MIEINANALKEMKDAEVLYVDENIVIYFSYGEFTILSNSDDPYSPIGNMPICSLLKAYRTLKPRFECSENCFYPVTKQGQKIKDLLFKKK